MKIRERCQVVSEADILILYITVYYGDEKASVGLRKILGGSR